MQQRQSSIARWCERIIEGGWLLALVLIPSYFNLLSSRHFEPDKATALRGIVLVMAAAGIVRWLERSSAGEKQPPGDAASAGPGWWTRLREFPLALPVLLFVIVFLFSTAVSVAPGVSFWGSYQRLQGTYTNLSYVGLAVLVALNLRRREQLERLITVAVLGSLPAVGYGLVQHFQLDPLPWRGDVVSRVASTMGNSIFVAAYLIMVLPFALYKAITGFHGARGAPREGGRSGFGWAVAYLLLVLGGLALVFAALQFGAVVRTADLRYWWVYPGAIVAAFALFLVPTLRPHVAERVGLAVVWPAIVAVSYVLLVGFFFTIGQGSGLQEVRAQPGRGGTEWPFWMLAGVVAVVAGYALMFRLPRQAEGSATLQLLQGAGMTVIALLLTITIFFTQSRGPWLGFGAGLFVFFTLLLAQAYRRARANGSPRARLWGGLLAGEVVAALLIAGFLAAFNLSDAPVFNQLRGVPYIGRMGRLFDTSAGTTGDVRMKIWFGDEQAGGAAALITADPLRTIVGWGPESMFVAYNRFYPPSLANVEARGASPDRSHQAYLDELVTKGLLGLISYLFVIISALALAWRLAVRTAEWRMQVLFLACIGVIVAHSVEGLTGIPIVATLMMLWVTLAVVVVGGALAGQYSLDPAPQPAAEPAAEPQPAKGQPQRGNNRRRTGAAARGAAQGRAATSRRPSQATNPAAMLVYTIIMVLALAGVWFMNVDNVYADMRFQQGQIYAEGSGANLQQQFVGLNYYLDAVRMEPEQDFYYLSLGRSLMSITDIRRQTSAAPLGTADSNVQFEDLLRLSDSNEAQTFIGNQSLLTTMSYAQEVLERAYELNPMNKDHSANLARLHTFWYSRLTGDPAQLQEAIKWYQRGHEIAPQDVVILNEYAGAVALLGTYTEEKGDPASAEPLYEQAGQLLAKSKQLDPRYSDTDIRTADLLRIRGRADEAVDQYIALVNRSPHVLDAQFNLIVNSIQGQPEQLNRLRASYEQAVQQNPDDGTLHGFVGQLAVLAGEYEPARAAFARQTELQPESLDARRNYTLVLSNTQEYSQAITEAEALLGLAQQQQDQQQAAEVQALIEFLRARQGG